MYCTLNEYLNGSKNLVNTEYTAETGGKKNYSELAMYNSIDNLTKLLIPALLVKMSSNFTNFSHVPNINYELLKVSK